MANVKKALLQKMIDGILVDLMIKTNVNNVVITDAQGTETLLSTVLGQMLIDLDELGDLAKKDKVSEADLADALATLINGKADKGTTLAAYSIADAYTKAQVDGLVSGVLHFKGTKDYQSALPTTGNKAGDVWLVKYQGTSGTTVWNAEFLWTESAWEMLGTINDMAGYVTTSAMNTALGNKVDKVTGKGLSTNDLTDELLEKVNASGRILHGTTPPADLGPNDLFFQLLD